MGMMVRLARGCSSSMCIPVTEAVFTFVAIDAERRPRPVPPSPVSMSSGTVS